MRPFWFWKRRGFSEAGRSAVRSRLTFGQVTAVLSVLALVAISFLGGAAVMYFTPPSSNILARAFQGGQTWFNHATAASTGAPSTTGPSLEQASLRVDKPASTWDGFTLLTTTAGPEALLLDMRGSVVHRWKMPSRRPWPAVQDVPDPFVDEPIHWERCHLFANGDVLAMCCNGVGSPYGYGLAKFDRDSNLLWGHAGFVHHDFDVGEDGRVYVLAHRRNAETKPHDGLEAVPSPYLADDLLILSPEGKELDRLPILEAFRDSPYFLTVLSETGPDPVAPFQPFALLHSRNRPFPPGFPGQTRGHLPPGGLPQPGGMPLPAGVPPPPDDRALQSQPADILHTNSVKVLRKELAPHFPLFKPGQILLSLRSPSTVAVLDLQTRAVVWAARGVWRAQHDANFLDNGHLLLFDNLGSAHGSRVLEYDPITQGIAWAYPDATSPGPCDAFRGAAQRLPNGNTLIAQPSLCRLVEVTGTREVVWEWGCSAGPLPVAGGPITNPLIFIGARRYSPDRLTFVKEAPRGEKR
jgi:hypothetical protein